MPFPILPFQTVGLFFFLPTAPGSAYLFPASLQESAFPETHQIFRPEQHDATRAQRIRCPLVSAYGTDAEGSILFSEKPGFQKCLGRPSRSPFCKIRFRKQDTRIIPQRNIFLTVTAYRQVHGIIHITVPGRKPGIIAAVSAVITGFAFFGISKYKSHFLFSFLPCVGHSPPGLSLTAILVCSPFTPLYFIYTELQSLSKYHTLLIVNLFCYEFTYDRKNYLLLTAPLPLFAVFPKFPSLI